MERDFDEFCRHWDCDNERIVAVHPVSDLYAVGIYDRLAHRPVKDEFGVFRVFGNVQLAAVPPPAWPRQCTRAPRMPAFDCFAVLLDYGNLNVVRFAERAANGPVVRNGNRLPCCAVAAEQPPVAQQRFSSPSRRYKHNDTPCDYETACHGLAP